MSSGFVAIVKAGGMSLFWRLFWGSMGHFFSHRRPEWRKTGRFPLIAGKWRQVPDPGSDIHILIRQSAGQGDFKGRLEYDSHGDHVTARVDGRIDQKGRITGVLVHLHNGEPGEWKSQIRCGRLDPDGKLISGFAWILGERYEEFTWEFLSEEATRADGLVERLTSAPTSRTAGVLSPIQTEEQILLGSWIVESRKGDYIGIWMFRPDRTVTGRTWLRNGNNYKSWLYDDADGMWEITEMRVAIRWKSLQPNGQPCHDELLRPIKAAGMRGDGWGEDSRDCWRAVKLHAGGPP